ncbi:MAG: hypothetical protein EXR98_18110 [Gemmataceae bacterium]|nr:hypothetical protein [Gemmataceae bacterium]
MAIENADTFTCDVLIEFDAELIAEPRAKQDRPTPTDNSLGGQAVPAPTNGGSAGSSGKPIQQP